MTYYFNLCTTTLLLWNNPHQKYNKNICLTKIIFFSVSVSCLSSVFTQTVSSPSENTNNNVPSITQTVYGFLDFTTTIGNTVMVFSPQSASTTSEYSNIHIGNRYTQFSPANGSFSSKANDAEKYLLLYTRFSTASKT